jgi:hypothetical protein
MKQRYINTKFWSDNWVSNLDPIEKLLFIYLLTNERTNIAGIYELPIKYMAVETGIEKEMIEKILKRFGNDNKVKYLNGWIYIYNFQKHQDLSNEKIRRGIEVIINDIPEQIRVSIGYPYPSNNSNSNSNSNINNTKVLVKTEYGNKDINTVIDFLKGKLGVSLDGSAADNRRYAHLLLGKVKKDYPDSIPVEIVFQLIEIGLKDQFHSKNITGFKYLYYNCNKIVLSFKSNKIITI